MIFHYLFKQQFKQLLKVNDETKKFQQLILIVLLLISSHTYLISVFEGLELFDSFWLTMTTIMTVGYGDIAAKTVPGRISTIVLMYLGGIYTLTTAVGAYFEHLSSKREKQLTGKWSWKMKNHLIIFCPQNITTEYLTSLIRELRASKGHDHCTVELVSENYKSGLDQKLTELGVVHADICTDDEESFHKLNINRAKTVVVLSDMHPKADALTRDIVEKVRHQGFTGTLIAECMHMKNKERLRQSGANSTPRVLRQFPEMISRSILSPGAEEVLELLFNSAGDECQKIDVALRCKWKSVLMFCIEKDLGCAMGYLDENSQVQTNPSVNTDINAVALYLVTTKSPQSVLKEFESFKP